MTIASVASALSNVSQVVVGRPLELMTKVGCLGVDARPAVGGILIRLQRHKNDTSVLLPGHLDCLGGKPGVAGAASQYLANLTLGHGRRQFVYLCVQVQSGPAP